MASDEGFVSSVQELEKFIALQERNLWEITTCSLFMQLTEWTSLFSETLPKHKLLTILKNLRFDVKSIRSERVKVNKCFHIRDIFEWFRHTCICSYTPNMSLTIDEQLLPLKTRCKLITFMPNKPDKYGLKFCIMSEVESKDVCNIQPYLGALEKDDRNGCSLGTTPHTTCHGKGLQYLL